MKRTSPSDLWFALALTAAFLALAGFSVFHHEMWRDELQAWLLARDSSSLAALAENAKYDGHPLLWFIVLWPLTRLTHHPEAMQIANLAIAGGAVFLIARYAPASRLLRGLAVFGYFPLYEYGTIARNYSLGLLFVTAFCSLFPRRAAHPLLMGLLLALAANTSAYALILVVAALFALAVDSPPERVGARQQALTLAGFGLALLGIAAAVLQTWPPPDSGYAVGWNLEAKAGRAYRVAATIVGAYAPLRLPGPDFFPITLPLPAWPGSLPFVALGGSIAAWTAVALARRPAALLYFATGTVSLLAFFYLKVLGFLRHHGFLFICFAAGLWLAKELTPRPLPKPLERLSDRAWRSLGAIVTVLLALQVIAAGAAVVAERQNVFSGAQAAAGLLRSRSLEGLPLLGDPDYAVTPVLGYLGKERAYYPAGGRFGSYVIWDQERLRPYKLWDEADRLSASLKSPLAVVLGTTALKKAFPAPDSIAPRLRREGCVEGRLAADESYCIFVLTPP